jgi:hypothetical protein
MRAGVMLAGVVAGVVAGLVVAVTGRRVVELGGHLVLLWVEPARAVPASRRVVEVGHPSRWRNRRVRETR